jgi:hypothetical protein
MPRDKAVGSSLRFVGKRLALRTAIDGTWSRFAPENVVAGSLVALEASKVFFNRRTPFGLARRWEE